MCFHHRWSWVVALVNHVATPGLFWAILYVSALRKNLFLTFSFLKEIVQEVWKGCKLHGGKQETLFLLCEKSVSKLALKQCKLKWFRLIQFLSILQTTLKQIVTNKEWRCCFTMREIVLVRWGENVTTKGSSRWRLHSCSQGGWFGKSLDLAFFVVCFVHYIYLV